MRWHWNNFAAGIRPWVVVLQLPVHMQPQCLIHKSGLSGREAERDRCATEVQKRDVCLPCGIPLMAFLLPPVVQVGVAYQCF